MQTKDFDYELPQELIAQKPLLNRDESRLLVFHRDNGAIEHRVFRDILEYLRPGDALVLNNTRVIPARLFGHKETGAAVEVLLLKRLEKDVWEALLKPGKRLKIGDIIAFDADTKAVVEVKKEEGVAVLRFSYTGVFEQVLERLGHTPLPPYIRETLPDSSRYQTVYARYEGSAAAPTAGLHFTPELLQKIRDKGVSVLELLLHVGLGTFRPVKADKIEEHHMHAEYYEISEETAAAYNRVRESGGRIFAVGTTSVRTLETVADENGFIRAVSGMTDIFIYPGYRFRAVDALITNFHLPQSTLLMLVSAFAGREAMLGAYREAVERQYRFFSFGDAMLII